MKLEKTTCDFGKVIKLFIKYHKAGWSMKEASAISFHKAQSRLGELERTLDDDGNIRSLKLKVRRLPMPHIKPNGRTVNYLNYKSLASLSYLINLHNKLCKQGNKAIQK
jgi:hypothetical protein